MQIESAVQEISIRERAYAIWEQEGRPEGRELDHWIRAIREIAPPPAAKVRVDAAPAKPQKRPARTRLRKASRLS